MRDGAEGSAGSRVDSARLQPAVGLDRDEDEDLPPDEVLDRKLGDAELLLELQLSRYAPEKWMPVANEFARYGYNVIVGWIRTGAIFEMVARATGHSLRRPDRPLDEDAITMLATDTVVAALDAFLVNVLMKNKWSLAGGASLKTFFIGQCKFQFRNVYRGWYRAEHRNRKLQLVDDIGKFEGLGGHLGAADAPLMLHETALAALGAVSTDRARLAMAMHSIGYSHAEIAIELGVADAKSVENLIGHQRRRLSRNTSIAWEAI
jgi:hypothetical protein